MCVFLSIFLLFFSLGCRGLGSRAGLSTRLCTAPMSWQIQRVVKAFGAPQRCTHPLAHAVFLPATTTPAHQPCRISTHLACDPSRSIAVASNSLGVKVEAVIVVPPARLAHAGRLSSHSPSEKGEKLLTLMLSQRPVVAYQMHGKLSVHPPKTLPSKEIATLRSTMPVRRVGAGGVSGSTSCSCSLSPSWFSSLFSSSPGASLVSASLSSSCLPRHSLHHCLPHFQPAQELLPVPGAGGSGGVSRASGGVTNRIASGVTKLAGTTCGKCLVDDTLKETKTESCFVPIPADCGEGERASQCWAQTLCLAQ